MKEQAEECNCLSIRAVTEPTCHGFKPFDMWREHNKIRCVIFIEHEISVFHAFVSTDH